jgi:hypothetical protein
MRTLAKTHIVRLVAIVEQYVNRCDDSPFIRTPTARELDAIAFLVAPFKRFAKQQTRKRKSRIYPIA